MRYIINFFSKLGIDSISKLLSLITLPIITRSLGPDGYGQFVYLTIVLSYFGFFVDFGYINYGTNEIFNRKSSSEVVNNIVALRLITALISILFIFVAGYFLFPDSFYVLLLIYSASFFFQAFSIKYYYLAHQRLYYNSLSELVSQVIFVISILIIFIYSATIQTLVLLTLLQTLISSLMLVIPYYRKYKFKFNFSLKENLIIFKNSSKLGFAAKFEGLTVSFIPFLLGLLVSEEAVGIFGVPLKIFLALLAVVQGISMTLMPDIFKNFKSDIKLQKSRIGLFFYSFLTTGIVLAFIIYFGSDIIVSLFFGTKFIESVSILKIFSITIILWSVLMFLGLIIIALNRYTYYLYLTASSAILSVSLSIVLINLFGLTGAGFVLPLTAFGSIVLAFYFLSGSFKNIDYSFSKMFSFSNAFAELKSLVFQRSVSKQKSDRN
ncbi:MAG: oligosaccharide flippase family protein [Ignavibacteria bacterium]|nr:oligosaccharide flippase family protein [Ignavibacteria bacterium]